MALLSSYVHLDLMHITSAVNKLINGVNNAPVAVTASGAITPGVQARYVITKAGVAAMTLAAPVAGAVGTGDDGTTIEVTSATAYAHTITATGLFEDGAATTGVATFPAHAGATIKLMAYNAKWIVVANNLVVMS